MLEEALEHLVKGIVEHPGEVRVDSRGLRRGKVLEVRVHPDDLGKVFDNAIKKDLTVRCVCFTTTGTWICLTSTGWWTSDVNHPVSAFSTWPRSEASAPNESVVGASPARRTRASVTLLVIATEAPPRPTPIIGMPIAAHDRHSARVGAGAPRRRPTK